MKENQFTVSAMHGDMDQEARDKVMDEFTTVIIHLQALTWPSETSGLEAALQEYQSIVATTPADESFNVASISKATDDFCGSAQLLTMSQSTIFARI